MRRILLAAALGLAAAIPAAAQDANFLLRIDTIEARLRAAPLQIMDARGSRAEGDRTLRITLAFEDGSVMVAKMAKAAPGGSAFNNEPRYEVAAYELQKLFLGPDEYVVPPTLMRSVPTPWLNRYDEGAEPTFQGSASTLILLQYWLIQVTPEGVWDKGRLERDSVYARHVANLNILTYLIRHNDANEGNFLISTFKANPRVFSVDNGLSFRSQASDRGYAWRNLRVDRLPRATVERLRAVTTEQLQALGVLVQFESQGPMLVAVAPGQNLDPGKGVRERDGVVQFGLTEREIADVASRLRSLLEDVDQGKIRLF